MSDVPPSEIAAEIAVAIERIGGNAELVARLRSTRDLASQLRFAISAELDKLGADIELSCAVGSYGDTVPDAEVLAMLKKYNASGQVLDVVDVEASIPGADDSPSERETEPRSERRRYR